MPLDNSPSLRLTAPNDGWVLISSPSQTTRKMTVLHQTAQSSPAFSPSDRIRIADLAPNNWSALGAYIDAQVALIWPYSSSSGKFSLLLAETDVRLHKTRRQVKVTFYNGAAKATQASRVGIGDTVKLKISGCSWTQTGDVVSTPGKKIDWDIEIRDQVTLRVNSHVRLALRPKLTHFRLMLQIIHQSLLNTGPQNRPLVL